MKMKTFVGIFCVQVVVTFALEVTPNSNESESEIHPFSSPMEEFDRIEKECEDRGIQGFEAAREEHQKCLNSKENKTAETDESCNDKIRGNSACWVGITQKIEECLPGRGKTVESIHTAFRLEFYCNPNFTAALSKLETSGKLCSAEVHKTSQCSDVMGMTSPDLCTSYTAQKLCEDSNLVSCPYPEHKELMQTQLKEVGRLLGCKVTELYSTTGPAQAPVVGKSARNAFSTILLTAILFIHH